MRMSSYIFILTSVIQLMIMFSLFLSLEFPRIYYSIYIYILAITMINVRHLWIVVASLWTYILILMYSYSYMCACPTTLSSRCPSTLGVMRHSSWRLFFRLLLLKWRIPAFSGSFKKQLETYFYLFYCCSI